MLEERGSGIFLDSDNDSRTFIEYQAGPATLLSSPWGLINSCDSQRACEVDIMAMLMLWLRKLRHRAQERQTSG